MYLNINIYTVIYIFLQCFRNYFIYIYFYSVSETEQEENESEATGTETVKLALAFLDEDLEEVTGEK